MSSASPTCLAPFCPRCVLVRRGVVVNTCSVVASVGLVDRGSTGFEGRGARTDTSDGGRRASSRHPGQLRVAGHGREPVGRANGRRAPRSRGGLRGAPPAATARAHGLLRRGRGRRRLSRRRRRRSRPAPTSCSTAVSPACGWSTDGSAPGSTTPGSACSSTGTTRASAGWKCRGRWSVAVHAAAVPVGDARTSTTRSRPRSIPTRSTPPTRAPSARSRDALRGVHHPAPQRVLDVRHAQSDHTIMHSAYGRDIVREFADAFRAEGLRIGFYYSLSDWHHPDYPPFREEHKPYLPGFTPPRPSDEQAERFRAYLLGQLRELLTELRPDRRAVVRRAVGASPRPVARRRDRGARPRAAAGHPHQRPAPRARRLPHARAVRPADRAGRRWETCFTMNDSWGWNPDDTNYKCPRAIVHALCETAGRGGNLLLNVSPRGDGSLPAEQIERLDAVAAWMADAPHRDPRHRGRARAVAVLRPVDAPRRPHLPVLPDAPVRHGDRARAARSSASSGSPCSAPARRLGFSTRTGVLEQLSPIPTARSPSRCPRREHDAYATVLAIDLAAEPIEGRRRDPGGGGGFMTLRVALVGGPMYDHLYDAFAPGEVEIVVHADHPTLNRAGRDDARGRRAHRRARDPLQVRAVAGAVAATAR